MPAHKKDFWKKGVVDPLIVIGIAVLLIALPAAVRVVQERQEVRKKASLAEPCKICSGGRCVTIASPPMCTSSLNECSSNSECAQPTPTSPPVDHECFTPDDCEAPGRCNVDCRGWPRKCRWTSCPEPTPTSPPEPTSPPVDHECFTPDDCEAPGRCNVDCRGWPRKCRWTACPTPTPTPRLTPTPTPVPGCKQKYQPCSGTGQGNCCSGLMCAPLPGGKFCLVPTCQEGEKKCSEGGKYVQECQNGQWVNIRICDAGCSNATCSQICTPGATRCFDSQTQETCSSDGGAWGKQSCPYGCSGGKCNPAPSPTPTPTSIPPTMTPTPLPTPAPRPTVTPTPRLTPTSTPQPIPPPIARVTPTPSAPLIGGELVPPETPLPPGAVGWTRLPGPPGQEQIVPIYPVPQGPLGPFQELADVALMEMALPLTVFGLATAPEWVPAAAPAISTGLTYLYASGQSLIATAPTWAQTALRVASQMTELAGTGYLAYECSQGNQEACMAGGVGLQTYFQQQSLEAIARSQATGAVQIVDELAATEGTTFAAEAAGTRGGGTYVASGGQRLIINPERDPALQKYLAEVEDYMQTARTSRAISRAPLVTEYVHETIRYGGKPYYPELEPVRQAIYEQGRGTAWLGQFAQCRLGVCREQAALTHVALAQVGKESEIVVGNVGAFRGAQNQGRHAWVEFVDTVTGKRMVADATRGWVRTVEEAYQHYRGVSDLIRQIFVRPR